MSKPLLEPSVLTPSGPPQTKTAYPQPPLNSSSSHHDKWWPYSCSKDFDANLAVILVMLVCAFACILAVNAAVRYILRWWRRDGSPPELTKPPSVSSAPRPVLPTLAFSSGSEEVKATECAICLWEFVDGERVAMLPVCRHCFHVKCADSWVASHDSCPTCRASCVTKASLPVGRKEGGAETRKSRED